MESRLRRIRSNRPSFIESIGNNRTTGSLISGDDPFNIFLDIREQPNYPRATDEDVIDAIEVANSMKKDLNKSGETPDTGFYIREDSKGIYTLVYLFYFKQDVYLKKYHMFLKYGEYKGDKFIKVEPYSDNLIANGSVTPNDKFWKVDIYRIGGKRLLKKRKSRNKIKKRRYSFKRK
jgi:hypothetical protein